MSTLEHLQQKINNALKQLPLTKEPYELYAPVTYTLYQDGKRIRPLFALIANEIFDGNIDEALPAATAIEIFHNFTLLHDDIIDKAPLRRGVETVYQKWNTNVAILSGDTMFAIAYGELAKSKPGLLPGLMSIFTQTAIEVCEGQQYDIDFETKGDVTLGEYINMIKLKTAVLLAASLKIGAIIAGASEQDADNLYRFGINLGISFQLQDDLLDTFSDVAVFGKQNGGDIAANKKTILFIKALELADEQSAARLRELYAVDIPGTQENSAQQESKVREVIEIFTRFNVKTVTEEIINRYFDKAIESLDALSVSGNQTKVLRDIAYSILQRKK